MEIIARERIIHKMNSGLNFDTSALLGLRGFLALYILLFHSLLYSDLRVNILGQAIIPWFYLLSGFSLALRYTDHEIGSKTFVQRRLYKILPIYYFSLVLAFPLIFLGHNYFHPKMNHFTFWSCLLSLLGVQSWVVKYGFGPVGPSWTLSTLWFFYLNYQWIQRRLEKKSNGYLQNTIITCHFTQLVLGTLLYFVPHWTGYWLATAWPISRIPIFVMGVSCGILCKRMDSDTSDTLSTLLNKNWVLPLKSNLEANLLLYVVCILSLFLAKTLKKDLLLAREGIFNTFLQLFFVYMQAMMMITLCIGHSRIANALKCSILQFLGHISYALYLIHEPVLYWINYMYFGPIEWHDNYKPGYIRLPAFLIPVHVLLSIGFAAAVTFVERKCKHIVMQYFSF